MGSQVPNEATARAGGVSAAEPTFRRVRRRLLPFLFLLYIVAYLDRINVGFASLQMNRELGLSETVFGFGAGVFFVGYFLFEIPSNLILARVGARRWLARILVSWGIAAIAMVWVRGPRSFYALRFLLGVAEAGFFPGVILYLTYWFPAREQARAVALFMTATAVAGIVGGPISGALLELSGLLGLSGWQWLFLIEGIPAVVLGAVVLMKLPDGPREVRWLSDSQRTAISSALAAERDSAVRKIHLGAAFATPRVWILAVVYFGTVVGIYGINLWLPQIVAGFHMGGTLAIGFITTIPFLLGAIAMVVVARRSDRTGERRWHLTFSLAVAAIGLLASSLAANPIAELLTLSIGAAGTFCALGPFWAMPPEFLDGPAAAGGIALINSFGNLGGFLGPYLVGVMRESTHGFSAALFTLAASLALAALIASTLKPARLSSISTAA